MNFETGLKEAKLLKEDDSKLENNQLSVPLGEEPHGNDGGTEMNVDNLEHLLQNIPSDQFEYSEDELKRIKSKFKTYDEIKADMGELKMEIKADNEIIDSLFTRYETNLTGRENEMDDEKLVILEDLEYLVHQIDNAMKFLLSEGLEKIIMPNLINQTNIKLRMKSLNLLGSIMQNNQKAQIFVFEKNVGDHLTKYLSNSKSAEELSALIYAYGSLLRKFPFAQREILPKTGLAVLLSLLSESKNTKLNTKILTLFCDLIQEARDAVIESLESPTNVNRQRVEQYRAVDFENILKNSTYCEVVDNFVRLQKSEILDELDFIEKVINTCRTTHEICYDRWSESPMFRHFLLVLKHRYDGMKDNDAHDGIVYHETLMAEVNLLFENLDFKEMALIRDEL